MSVSVLNRVNSSSCHLLHLKQLLVEEPAKPRNMIRHKNATFLTHHLVMRSLIAHVQYFPFIYNFYIVT